MHLLFHPGVGNDKFAVIGDEVADETVEELGERFLEEGLRIQNNGVDLGQGIRQTVSDLHDSTIQLLQ